eukprot:15461397-Alexandrium_andersonii.AAC.1
MLRYGGGWEPSVAPAGDSKGQLVDPSPIVACWRNTACCKLPCGSVAFMRRCHRLRSLLVLFFLGSSMPATAIASSCCSSVPALSA